LPITPHYPYIKHMPSYDSKTKAKAKLQYSQGKSLRQISEKTGIHEETLKKWKAADGWIKGDLLQKITEKMEETTIETAARLGATKAYVIQKAFELSQAQNIAMPNGTGYNIIPIDEDTIDANGFCGVPPENLQKIPDRKFQHEGNKLLADILKLRDKEQGVIIAPQPVLIMAEDGAQIAVLGFDQNKKA